MTFLSISLPIIDWFSKFFHWHTADNLQSCDYYISHHIVYVSLHYLVKYECITITNTHFGKIENKTLQTIGAVGCIVITLLQIVRRVCRWKNFENRSIIGEVTNKSKVPRFSWRTGVEFDLGNLIIIQVNFISLTLKISSHSTACLCYSIGGSEFSGPFLSAVAHQKSLAFWIILVIQCCTDVQGTWYSSQWNL